MMDFCSCLFMCAIVVGEGSGMQAMHLLYSCHFAACMRCIRAQQNQATTHSNELFISACTPSARMDAGQCWASEQINGFGQGPPVFAPALTTANTDPAGEASKAPRNGCQRRCIHFCTSRGSLCTEFIAALALVRRTLFQIRPESHGLSSKVSNGELLDD